MFHLAIPCRDLKEAKEFYETLGCKIGRQYNTHIIIDFFGDQLVCRLANQDGQFTSEPKMYPRHFGPILKSEQELKALWFVYGKLDCVFEGYFERHKGKDAEHHTFFLKDPSNNLIEFKWYKYKSQILGDV